MRVQARWQVQPGAGGNTMNISQISYEWPATFLDVVEWQQHQNKSGVFFHEEGVFSLWTMKVMDIDPTKHMVFFLCIGLWVVGGHQVPPRLLHLARVEPQGRLRALPHARARGDWVWCGVVSWCGGVVWCGVEVSWCGAWS